MPHADITLGKPDLSSFPSYQSLLRFDTHPPSSSHLEIQREKGILTSEEREGDQDAWTPSSCRVLPLRRVPSKPKVYIKWGLWGLVQILSLPPAA